MILTKFFGFFRIERSADPSTWSIKKIDKWFENGEWLNGWIVSPDASINRKAFIVSYFKNKERWDKAFIFCKNNDLSKLELKRYNIDGENLYAIVSGYLSKNEENARFEVHRKYIDIQCIISGVEQIGIAPESLKEEILVPYDVTNDIEFLTVNHSVNYIATPDKFFIFFPSDAHRPGLKVGENTQVRKIVIKVRID